MQMPEQIARSSAETRTWCTRTRVRMCIIKTYTNTYCVILGLGRSAVKAEPRDFRRKFHSLTVILFSTRPGPHVRFGANCECSCERGFLLIVLSDSVTRSHLHSPPPQHNTTHSITFRALTRRDVEHTGGHIKMNIRIFSRHILCVLSPVCAPPHRRCGARDFPAGNLQRPQRRRA